MKKALVLGAALAATAATASAGVRIETITRDIKTQAAQGAAHIVEVQGGALRASTDQGGLLLKGGVITFIDDKRKTYTEMDKAKMEAMANKANAAMAQMQERMKNMPPEQRAQMEKMMGGMMPGGGGKAPVFTSKDTGKTDTVEGRKCRIWHLLKDGQIAEEMCVVPFASLPGKEDMQKSFKEMSEAFAGFASAVPGAQEQSKVRMGINGYPVRSRPYLNGQPFGTESIMKSWTEANIPAATFAIPSGYKKKDMPQMGGG
jgi:hypothetical protein